MSVPNREEKKGCFYIGEQSGLREAVIDFKAIKKNLKIKAFLGTNANAVKTQVWTALIAMTS